MIRCICTKASISGDDSFCTTLIVLDSQSAIIFGYLAGLLWLHALPFGINKTKKPVARMNEQRAVIAELIFTRDDEFCDGWPFGYPPITIKRYHPLG